MSEGDDLGPVFLRGEQVTLHTVEGSDLDALRAAMIDPAVGRLYHHRAPMNRQEVEEFAESFEDDSEYGFTVVADGTRVGFAFLSRVDHDKGTAWPGVVTLREHRGEGYATDALRTLVRWAFEELRLAKLSVETAATNDAGRRVLAKVGFEHEGTLRGEQYVGGERVDVMRYGLLPGEVADE